MNVLDQAVLAGTMITGSLYIAVWCEKRFGKKKPVKIIPVDSSCLFAHEVFASELNAGMTHFKDYEEHVAECDLYQLELTGSNRRFNSEWKVVPAPLKLPTPPPGNGAGSPVRSVNPCEEHEWFDLRETYASPTSKCMCRKCGTVVPKAEYQQGGVV